MKVALIHDYLREYGGAERVLEALHDIFPDAPVYVAYYQPSGLGPHRERISKWDVRTTWMQRIPFAGRLISPFRVFAVNMFKSLDLSDYEIIISSANSYFAKSVKTTPGQLHIAYIHSPPRYLYGFTTSYNYKKHWWTRIGAELMNHYLRVVDFEVSQKPDILVANSQTVADRIKKFYRRDAQIVYPPVDIERFAEARVVGEGGYFLSVGRLFRGKGIDIIVKACSHLKLPLKVVGTGPELENLKAMAGKSVQFLGELNDEETIKMFANAGATIVASEDEDFGIVPIESMAAGTPVIAVKAGGFRETVVPGKTGEFFARATVEDLIEVLKTFDSTNYKYKDCQKQAKKFSQERFKKEILGLTEVQVKLDT